MLFQIALDQPIDEADVMRLLRPDRIAARRHFERLRDARDARQALGPAGAGQDAELHLRHAELRGRDGDSIMTGERDLEPAAERGSVDRGDHRLGAIFDDVDDLRQHRLREGLGGAEFADVRAGEEGLAEADDDDRLHRLVGIGRLDRLDQPLAHRVPERVDRRIVRLDDQDVAMDLGGNRAHRSLPSPPRCRLFT